MWWVSLTIRVWHTLWYDDRMRVMWLRREDTPVNLIALFEQKLGEVGAVLASDA